MGEPGQQEGKNLDWIQTVVDQLEDSRGMEKFNNQVDDMVSFFCNFPEVANCFEESTISAPIPPSRADLHNPSPDLEALINTPARFDYNHGCPYKPKRHSPEVDVKHSNPFLDVLSNPEGHWERKLTKDAKSAWENLSFVRGQLQSLADAFLTHYVSERDAEIAVYGRLQKLIDKISGDDLVIQAQWDLNRYRPNTESPESLLRPKSEKGHTQASRANGVIMMNRAPTLSSYNEYQKEKKNHRLKVQDWSKFTAMFHQKVEVGNRDEDEEEKKRLKISSVLQRRAAQGIF